MHEWHMKLGVGQKVEDGAYLDENCFSSDVNYQIFKTYYMPLKKFPAFHSSFGYNKKHTNVSYCFSELDAKLYSFIKVN